MCDALYDDRNRSKDMLRFVLYAEGLAFRGVPSDAAWTRCLICCKQSLAKDKYNSCMPGSRDTKVRYAHQMHVLVASNAQLVDSGMPGACMVQKYGSCVCALGV